MRLKSFVLFLSQNCCSLRVFCINKEIQIPKLLYLFRTMKISKRMNRNSSPRIRVQIKEFLRALLQGEIKHEYLLLPYLWCGTFRFNTFTLNKGSLRGWTGLVTHTVSFGNSSNGTHFLDHRFILCFLFEALYSDWKINLNLNITQYLWCWEASIPFFFFSILC